MRHGAGRGAAVGAGGAFFGRAGPGAAPCASQAAAARLRRGQLRRKFSGVERGGRRLSGGLRPFAGRRGAGGDAGPRGAQCGSGAQVSVSVPRRSKDRASAAGVGAGAGELHPGRERAVAGFGAGEPRGGAGIGPPLRYVAIRIRKKQQALFADGSAVKYFAVVSNLWEWTPKRLLQWHREKAGSIEAVHDVIKNELAGGVMPCGRFGANAAWLRLAVLSYNVLTALKRLALPPELLTARPKRLRFLIFHTPGKLVHHARRTLLRLARSWNRFSNWQYALRGLPLPAPC